MLASGTALAVAGGLSAVAFAVSHTNSPSSGAAVTHVTAARPPLRVVSSNPANGARHVDGTRPVTITFNEPLPASAPLPRLSPSVPGTWQRSGNSVTFTPSGSGIPAHTTVTVSMPKSGSLIRSGYESKFTTARYSTLRLQQVLGQLGYLPLSWSPYLGGAVTPGSVQAQAAAAYSPPTGSFTWHGGYPGQLHSMWKEGSPNLIDDGAVAAFENDHGLRPDGTAGPKVWAALLKAAADGKQNTHGYSYAVASKNSPESLTIWHDGKMVLSSPANTGIPAAPTADGTFWVYEKLPFQIMRGTNPGGSHYADPVEWVSYFNGGQAVHYFSRGSYGWPQSLGCVELPYTEAKRSYRYLPYGTLVSVDP